METSVAPEEYKSWFGYLPSTIIKNVIDDENLNWKDINCLPQHYETETVGLFSDISGFTKLSEAFSKKGRVGPELWTFCINRYMELIINIIGANGGDIFKFAGDAIMVIWPVENNKDFLDNACKRAVHCACDIQNKLNNLEIVRGKFLSVKIGIGIGKCQILFVGGLFGRSEYWCVGEAMRQACTSETHASEGGQIIMSEWVQKRWMGSYNFIKAEWQEGYTNNDNWAYYMIQQQRGEVSAHKGSKIKTKADAFLMQKGFDKKAIQENFEIWQNFIPAAVRSYLSIEQESWCREIRCVTSMFWNIKIDLSQWKDESAFDLVQNISYTVQRCIYRTRGGWNKFWMDDKGSVMLIVWGIPPYSSRNDPLCCVCSGLTIWKELKKLGFKCAMGVATGTCFTGVCGTIGNRREYSLLGEMVNLSSRYMSKALEWMKSKNLSSKIVIDEKTKDLIQNKIRCKYLLTSMVKGFAINFNFFEPLIDEDIIVPTEWNPFPYIRTHYSNSLPFIDNYKINNTHHDLKFSLNMCGRTVEKELFIKKLNDITSARTRQVITITGQYGAGKSLFLRKCLYSFIRGDKDLNKIYYDKENMCTSNPNFIWCSYQYPILQFVPYNAFAFIFRQIYLFLKAQVFDHEKKRQMFKRKTQLNPSNADFIGDSFARLILEHCCLKYVDCINEMFNCSIYDDVNIKTHFVPKTKFPDDELNKKRDPFFSNYKLRETSDVNGLLIRLMRMYRGIMNEKYKDVASVPLVFIIEDIHCIDEYSLSLINALRDDSPSHDANRVSLNPFILIWTYQEQFSSIKSPTDLIKTKAWNWISPMSLKEFDETSQDSAVVNMNLGNFTHKNKVVEWIKNYVMEKDESQRFDSLFKVDPIWITILIDKSYCGIPLFIRELIAEFFRCKYIQYCCEEILITSELEDMDKLRNWNDFVIPLRLEKICGEMIDSIKQKEIIILKHASVIGNWFDIQKLHSIIPFNNITMKELYSTLVSFEEKGIIQILYDLDYKHKSVVFKFSFPFLKEILYQRMLIDQRNEIHMSIARILQLNKIRYLPTDIEKAELEQHWINGRDSVLVKMEEASIAAANPSWNDDTHNNSLRWNTNTLKILWVKEICDKLNEIKIKVGNKNIDNIKGPSKLSYALRYGMIDKKSDGKITWESRFFVMTPKTISYYYKWEEYIEDKVPWATFELIDVYNIIQLKDGSIGGRDNIFSWSVTKWIKKKEPQGSRTYIFSCKDMVDFYTWWITFNFIKVNAYYLLFVSNFGRINWPLFKRDDYSWKVGKYFSKWDCVYSPEDCTKNTSISMYGGNTQKHSKRGSWISILRPKAATKENTNIQKDLERYFKKLMGLSWGALLRKMQHNWIRKNLTNNNYNDNDAIVVPEHILRNLEYEEDLISFSSDGNDNSKNYEEEETNRQASKEIKFILSDTKKIWEDSRTENDEEKPKKAPYDWLANEKWIDEIGSIPEIFISSIWEKKSNGMSVLDHNNINKSSSWNTSGPLLFQSSFEDSVLMKLKNLSLENNIEESLWGGEEYDEGE